MAEQQQKQKDADDTAATQQQKDADDAAATDSTVRIDSYERELRDAASRNDTDAIEAVTKRYNTARVKRHKAASEN